MALTYFPNGVNLSGFSIPTRATITVGSEVGDEINVQVQIVDGNGDAVDSSCAVTFYLSDDSAGDGQTAAATSLAIGTNGTLLEFVDSTNGLLITDASGLVDITIGDATGAATYYLVLVMPTGETVVSSAITFGA